MPAASAACIGIAQICQIPKLIRSRQKGAQSSSACKSPSGKDGREKERKERRKGKGKKELKHNFPFLC